MKEHKMSFNISTMCKILKVSQSCYYQWIKQGSIVHKVDEQLNELIKEIFEQSRQTYGTRRIREALMKKHGIVQSMSKKGDCWDNAVSESFFHTLKTELTHHENFQTKAEANEKIFEYIEIFYNRQRLHSSNNYMSPVEFEEKMLQKEIVA